MPTEHTEHTAWVDPLAWAISARSDRLEFAMSFRVVRVFRGQISPVTKTYFTRYRSTFSSSNSTPSPGFAFGRAWPGLIGNDWRTMSSR